MLTRGRYLGGFFPLSERTPWLRLAPILNFADQWRRRSGRLTTAALPSPKFCRQGAMLSVRVVLPMVRRNFQTDQTGETLVAEFIASI